MNETLIQALIRLLVIFVLAGVGAVGVNLTILKDSISDPIMAAAVEAIAGAVLAAIAKYLGGATEQSREIRGRARAANAAERPNPLAI